MLSRSSLLRYALVAAISAMSAMALVGTAVYAHNDGFNERIVACFDSRDPDSEQCRAALEVSPVDADFFTRLAANVQMPQPKPEPKPELYTLLRECAATKNLDSDACARAIDASGLSPEDFKAKFAAKLGCISISNNDETNPCPVKKPECASTSNQDENNPCAHRTSKPDCATASNNDKTNPCAKKSTVQITTAVKECIALRASMSGMSAREHAAKAERVYAVCRQALAESRLTASEFWSNR
ncbi:MAG TPA: hypothetical protein VGR46_13605 [Candidatus Limnocylindria bacterium]|jgi:hypothetical protein|nr:hypothetical protein [Candidatus Limnocylindria bacterium]